MDRPGSVSLVSQVCEMRVGDGGLWACLDGSVRSG